MSRKPAAYPMFLKKFRGTDKEQQEFLLALPGDAREDFEQVMNALKSKKVSDIWHPVKQRPERPGWYATARLDLPSLSVPRYFDDTAPDNVNWFIARSNGGGDGLYEEHEEPLVVNMSFDMWCELPVLAGSKIA
jgi:hypothetical protein